MIALQFALIVLLILANGFFAASEISVVSARRGRLQQRAEAGERGARAALDLAEEPNRFLATVQVGITLIGTFSAAFGGEVLSEPLAARLAPMLGEATAQVVALGLIVLLLTYLSLILGELVPKRLALQHAEGMAIRAAPVMQFIARLAAPVIWFLTTSTQVLLRLLGQHKRSEEQVTEEDVLSLVREGAAGGTVEASERELIERVFDFTDASARSIMTPRTEIVGLAEDTPLDQAVRQAVDSGYSRIPVYRGSVDTIVGVVYAKDLLCAYVERDSGQQLTTLMRPPLYVLEHQPLSEVLQLFRKSRTHLAVVVDEYGQVDGLLTLEDVLEELTGDIADEYDESGPLVLEREDGSYLVDGLLPYGDAQQRLALPPREELADLPPFDTVAGLMLALLERIPQAGETIQWRDWQFEIVDMDGVRIDKILVRGAGLPDGRSQSEGALALGAVLPPPDDSARGSNTHLGRKA